jgi:uncharacterized secreted protein with C-terminal beta-propeller domain
MTIPKEWGYIPKELGVTEYHEDEERVWQHKKNGTAIVARLYNGKYYVVPGPISVPIDNRKGPYKTLKHACTVADTMMMLNAVPEEWIL